MKVAIASGKGGTGKTTVSVNLAWVLSCDNIPVCYLDCDVEEPNGHLFLKPLIKNHVECCIMIPQIDASKCTTCGKCVSVCQYNALARIGKEILVVEDLCHGCGGCMLLCPNKAISEKKNIIGVVETGRSDNIDFVHGRLNIGKTMSPPVIRQVLSHTKNSIVNIIDSPPGTSCPAISSIKEADYVLLVTEPTPFGLNDLALAIEMVKEIGLPFSVIINRSDPLTQIAHDFCKQRSADIIAEIPDNRHIAELCSEGELFCKKIPEYKDLSRKIWKDITSKAPRIQDYK